MTHYWPMQDSLPPALDDALQKALQRPDLPHGVAALIQTLLAFLPMLFAELKQMRQTREQLTMTLADLQAQQDRLLEERRTLEREIAARRNEQNAARIPATATPRPRKKAAARR